MRVLRERLTVGLAALALCVATAEAQAQKPTGTLTVELNKFEAGGDSGCQAFFLFRNATDNSFEGFEMSLAILDKSGVIDQLLTIDAAPLPVARTTLKLFEIPQIGCGDISEVLLHDVGVCLPQNGEQLDCFELVKLVSRTSAGLVK